MSAINTHLPLQYKVKGSLWGLPIYTVQFIYNLECMHANSDESNVY